MSTMATRAQTQTIRTNSHNTSDPGMKPGMERARDADLLEEMTSGMEEIDVPEMPDALGVQVDDPVFYADLDHAVERANRCQQYTEQIQAKLKVLLSAAEAHRQACNDLGMLLDISSQEFKLCHTDNESEPLKACSQLLHEFDAAFAESTSTMYDIVDVKLNRVSQKFKTLVDCRDQMIQSHNKYTTTMTKFCGTGFGDDRSASEDFHRRSHKAYRSKKAAHLTALNTVDVLHEIMSLTKVDVVKQTIRAVMAEASFFARGAKITQPHTPKMNARHDILQNVQLRAEGAHTLELQRLEKIRQEVLSCYEQEVALIPRDFERSHGLSATLKRAVRKQDSGSPKWSRISRKTSASKQWRKSRRRGTAEATENAKDAQGVSSLTCAPTGHGDGIDASGGIAGPTTVVPQPSLHALRRKRGYMFQRVEKKWRLEYLAIDQHRLVRVGDTGTTEELVNLLLATIRAGDNTIDERHHCLTIITPSDRLQLQALGPKDYGEWVLALQQGIADALDMGNADNGDDKVSQDHVSLLTSIPGNDSCADCGAFDTEWASINLGILLCIKCSGVHRSLGVHISKVRSVNLDRWAPDTLKFMQSVGNSRFNERYEGSLHATGHEKPSSSTPKAERNAYIHRKYIDKAYEDTSAHDPLVQATPPPTGEQPRTSCHHSSTSSFSASATERGNDDNSIDGDDSDDDDHMERRPASDLAAALRNCSHVDVEYLQGIEDGGEERDFEQLQELSWSSKRSSSFSASSTAGTMARLVRNAATRRKPSPISRRRHHQRASAPAHSTGDASGPMADEEEQPPSTTAMAPVSSAKRSRFRPHTPRMLKRFSFSNSPLRRETEPSTRKLELWLNHLQETQSDDEGDSTDPQLAVSSLPSPHDEQSTAFWSGPNVASHDDASSTSSNKSLTTYAGESGVSQPETSKVNPRPIDAGFEAIGKGGADAGSRPSFTATGGGEDGGDKLTTPQQTSKGAEQPKRHNHQRQGMQSRVLGTYQRTATSATNATNSTTTRRTASALTKVTDVPTPSQATTVAARRHVHHQPVRKHHARSGAPGTSRSMKSNNSSNSNKSHGREQDARSLSAARKAAGEPNKSSSSKPGNKASLFSQLIGRERELRPAPTPATGSHHVEESVPVRDAGTHTLGALSGARIDSLEAPSQQQARDSHQQGMCSSKAPPGQQHAPQPLANIGPNTGPGHLDLSGSGSGRSRYTSTSGVGSSETAPSFIKELEDHLSHRISPGNSTMSSTRRDERGRQCSSTQGHNQHHQPCVQDTEPPPAVLKTRGSTPASAGGKAVPQHTQTVLGASLDSSTLRKLHSSGQTHREVSTAPTPPSSPTRPRQTSRAALQASAARSTAL